MPQKKKAEALQAEYSQFSLNSSQLWLISRSCSRRRARRCSESGYEVCKLRRSGGKLPGVTIWRFLRFDRSESSMAPVMLDMLSDGGGGVDWADLSAGCGLHFQAMDK